MTQGEAQALLRSGDVVTVYRAGGQWTGRVVGIVPSPSLLLEDEHGQRRAIVLDGATTDPEKA